MSDDRTSVSVGQHVGAYAGPTAEAELLEAARAAEQVKQALMKPRRVNDGPRHDIGDGDACPIEPAHGRMLHLKATNGYTVTQYCAHVSHAGQPKLAAGGAKPPTRAFWPVGPDSFAAAVAEYHGRLVALSDTIPEVK
jgi:hypothetical protein